MNKSTKSKSKTVKRDTNTKIDGNTLKEEEKKFKTRINKAGVPKVVTAGNKREVPFELTLSRSIDATRTPISWLFALLNFTRTEYTEYIEKMGNNMTLGEIIAINTISDAVSRDKTAENRIWNLAEGVLRNKALAQAPVSIKITRDNSISMAMDKIADELFKNSTEGEVVHG